MQIMNLIRNKKGSAILISLFIIILLTVMSIVFLEKLLSFSKASEGIENSNVAYYHALGIIEEALGTAWVNKYQPWNIPNFWNGTANATSTGRSISTITWWTMIPLSGNGNSPYNPDWNIMSMGEPVQLVIPNGIYWGSTQFYFRIPNTGWWTPIIDPGTNWSGIILWTLTSTGKSLFASGETNTFKSIEIDGNAQSIDTRQWTSNTGATVSFDSFYNWHLWLNGNDCSNYKCTLKLSMIQPIKLINGSSLPFIEYKIHFNWALAPMIPQKFMKIHAEWYAYGFMRSKTLELPQITTNNALDFAVLQ